jgi:hypothetical protein
VQWLFRGVRHGRRWPLRPWSVPIGGVFATGVCLGDREPEAPFYVRGCGRTATPEPARECSHRSHRTEHGNLFARESLIPTASAGIPNQRICAACFAGSAAMPSRAWSAILSARFRRWRSLAVIDRPRPWRGSRCGSCGERVAPASGNSSARWPARAVLRRAGNDDGARSSSIRTDMVAAKCTLQV